MESNIANIKELANIHAAETNITDDDISLYIKETVRSEFSLKFPDDDFDVCWEKTNKIQCFSAIGNIYDLGFDIDKPTHYVMRLVATWHIKKALNALKFDTETDPNLLSDIDTQNIGTAGRIAKIWAGNGLDSENIREYGDGRWTRPPRLAAFPTKEKLKNKPVTVVIDNPGMGSVCSHHFLPYSIQKNGNSKIVISYFPKGKLLGLSKIGRFVEWCLNRPSLQEEVTTLIHTKISEIAETEDVYVGLLQLEHSCEVTRGAKHHSTTTTEEYSGVFEDIDVRNAVLNI